MKPLIKWPGGKSGEIKNFQHLIPKFTRYVEPFFGGGTLFFHLRPERAAINDASSALIEYYALVKSQDIQFKDLLLCYSDSFRGIVCAYNRSCEAVLNLYSALSTSKLSVGEFNLEISEVVESLLNDVHFSGELMIDTPELIRHITQSAADKFGRTVVNDAKRPFSTEELIENLLTGFTSGYYMYFRQVFNDISLGKIERPVQYKAANFYFIREYCYGSMFRYNREGEFNIPYGGMSYNKKDFSGKVQAMFNNDTKEIFKNTDIYCSDFEKFFQEAHLRNDDFMFLDPPYDTDFSDYEGLAFTKDDQRRLARLLMETPARFILVIKNTDFIYGLYNGHFNILTFDNRYTYNVRSRNQRRVEHLIITNM